MTGTKYWDALEKGTSERVHGPGVSVDSQTRVVSISAADIQRNRILALDDYDPISDQFKLLRTRVFQSTRPRGWNTIQVTSMGPGDGKSLVASNLAISMAKDTRQTTLLVDLDFRKPAIRNIFCLGSGVTGLEAYFLEDVPLEEIIVNPGIGKLTILPCATSVPNATELMGSPKMEALIRELKDRYQDRYIIFDTPGINTCPDPVILSEYMDGMLLVARANRTPLDGVTSAMELIPKEKVLGFVLNDVVGSETSGYYSYRYGS